MKVFYFAKFNFSSRRSIQLDFKRAFNSLWHNVLISKMMSNRQDFCCKYFKDYSKLSKEQKGENISSSCDRVVSLYYKTFSLQIFSNQMHLYLSYLLMTMRSLLHRQSARGAYSNRPISLNKEYFIYCKGNSANLSILFSMRCIRPTPKSKKSIPIPKDFLCHASPFFQ